MGIRRLAMTVLSLVLGLVGFYAVLHYVPAYLNPSHILRDSSQPPVDLRAERTGLMKLLGPYQDRLRLRSSYVWEGEGLEVRYALDEGQTAELIVTRCARLWVIEIVSCQAVEQSRVVVDHTTSRKLIRVSQPGFYEFREVALTGGEPRVIWRRNVTRS